MSDEDAALGGLVREGERVGLRFERTLAHSVDTVWDAITESSQLRHWLPTDIVGERRGGAALELPFWPDTVAKYEITEPALHGTVLRWLPPEAFSWTWDTDELNFELARTTGGEDGAPRAEPATLLVLTTWVADDAPESLVAVAAGYHVCLDLLAALLDDGPGRSTAEVDPRPLEKRYERHFAL